MAREKRPAPRGFRWVFVPRFTHWRSKNVIEPKDHAQQAFCFLVRTRGGG